MRSTLDVNFTFGSVCLSRTSGTDMLRECGYSEVQRIHPLQSMGCLLPMLLVRPKCSTCMQSTRTDIFAQHSLESFRVSQGEHVCSRSYCLPSSPRRNVPVYRSGSYRSTRHGRARFCRNIGDAAVPHHSTTCVLLAPVHVHAAYSKLSM